MDIAIITARVVTDIERKTFPSGNGSATRFRVKTLETRNTEGVILERSKTFLITVYSNFLQEKICPLLKIGQLVTIMGTHRIYSTKRDGGSVTWTSYIALSNAGYIEIIGTSPDQPTVHAGIPSDENNAHFPEEHSQGGEIFIFAESTDPMPEF